MRDTGRELLASARRDGLPKIDVRVVGQVKQGRLTIEDVEGKPGDQPIVWSRIAGRNSMNVLPIIKDGDKELYILTWKPQLSVQSWTFELIGGYTMAGETQAQTAVREVREEAGFDVGRLWIIDTMIGDFPGRIGWVNTEFAAEDLTYRGRTSTEVEERPIRIAALDAREMFEILQRDLVISAMSRATMWKYLVNRYFKNASAFRKLGGSGPKRHGTSFGTPVDIHLPAAVEGSA